MQVIHSMTQLLIVTGADMNVQNADKWSEYLRSTGWSQASHLKTSSVDKLDDGFLGYINC